MRELDVPVARQVFTFLGVGARALGANGGGTLIQITGGSSRRAIAGGARGRRARSRPVH